MVWSRYCEKFRKLCALFILIFVLGGMAAAPKMKTPGQVLGELEPNFRIFRPKSPGPHPTVMVFHGAADEAWKGPEGNEQYMHIITALRDKEYAVIFVDSYSGRGLSGSELRSGALLPAERAADLLVTLDWARKQSWVDRDRIAAVGFSHGATTIMDAFVLAPPRRRPTGLLSVPPGGLKGLRSAVLYYPFCRGSVAGFQLVKAVKEDWEVPVPMLAFLAGNDELSDAKLCMKILKRHQSKGLPVRVREYPDSTHGFDGQYGSPEDESLRYDEKAARDSIHRMTAFLAENLK